MRTAFLGLGIMGQPMAANLVKAGHEVAVWNRTPKSVDGARQASTPADAASGAEVVWMCLADTQVVEQVLFGENGVQDSLREGMIVVDSSTISPAKTVEFAARVRAKGAEYVDAPMTGSKAGAESAQLTFMVGASELLMEKLQPLFSVMGKQAIRMGDTGKGQATKISQNLIIALMFEGLAEGLTLATKLGIAPETLLSLVQASMARSGLSEYKAPFLLNRDYTPNFPLRLMQKDIHLMLEAAKQARVKLPALETVEEVYDVAAEEGMGDLDYSATLNLLEKWAGIEKK